MYYAPNRLLPGCACYWFTPIRYSINQSINQFISLVNSLAVSTDHWFPLKTAVAQYPRQVPKPPKKPQPATEKNCPPNESENRPIGRENRGTGNTGRFVMLLAK